MSRRPIMPNLERQVEVIKLDREQLRRGLLSTGGWSETVATEHVDGLLDTDGALQMLARHRIAFDAPAGSGDDTLAARLEYARACFSAVITAHPESAKAIARAGLDFCDLTAAQRAQMRGDA